MPMPIEPATRRGPARTTATLVIAALLAGATPAAAQTAPRTFSVADSAQLWTALRSARGGDTILLAPGHYGNVVYDRIRITDGIVNVRSADPANRARFGQMMLRGSSGLAFSGVDIQSSLQPIVSISGTNIRFTGNRIRGANPNGDPWDDQQTGMWVRVARNVVIASNDFQDLRAGVFVQQSTSVAIRHNDFTHLREGVNVAGATRGDIAYNRFEHFAPNFGAGEHADAIQFWNRNETNGVTHYRIRNNFLSLGIDGHVQGIFLGTENRALAHSDLEVSNNIYYGASFHGITFGNVTNSRVFNNMVLASPWADINNPGFRSADGRKGGGMPPAITLGWGAGVVASNNASSHLRGSTTGTGFSNSIDIWDSFWRRGEPLSTVLDVRPTARNPALAEFVASPTSVAASRGIGVLAPFKVGVVTLDPAAAQAFGASQTLP